MNKSNSLDKTMERIKEMELYMDEIIHLLETNPFSIEANLDIQNKIQILKNYYDNGQWLKDYEADERGDLPFDLKRGVLAQDTLYNLFDSLNHIEDIGIVMEGTILEMDMDNLMITIQSNEDDSIIIFHMCEEVLIYDQNKERTAINVLKTGMQIQICHAEFMTMSIPPQTTVYQIVLL